MFVSLHQQIRANTKQLNNQIHNTMELQKIEISQETSEKYRSMLIDVETKDRELRDAQKNFTEWCRQEAESLTKMYANCIGKYVRIVVKRTQYQIENGRDPITYEGYLTGFELGNHYGYIWSKPEVVPILYQRKKDGGMSKRREYCSTRIGDIDYIEIY